MEIVPLRQAVPHTPVHPSPGTGCWSLPGPGRTYVDHRAARPEGEDDVDVGAVGQAPAGRVGQEELQPAHQVPGHAHLDGAGLAQHGDCGERGSCYTESPSGGF